MPAAFDNVLLSPAELAALQAQEPVLVIDTRDADEAGTGGAVGALASTTVHFADISDAEIEAYVATGEPLAVAGAFTLDGLGGAFVTGVEGDPHNVVGVSVPTLRRLTRDLGVSWVELWHCEPPGGALD